MNDALLDEVGDNDDLDDLCDERTWSDLLGGALAPGDILADKYRVEEILGHGAMGFVLRAWHLQLDEPVAVKFLLPELAANHEALVRFEREARAAFKIRSEHVARVLDVGRLGSGQPFMVMEYLEGVELGDKVYGQQMNIEELAEYMLQACDALAEAHALGIVHRDMKPDNLFLTVRRDGSTCVKLLDFGLSKVVGQQGVTAKRQKAITAEAQVLGTAHYMSPEQWIASKDVGPAADIWSLGVILYEAITGESPFMRNNLAAMCNAVLRDEPPPLAEHRSDVPDGLEAVVRRCLAKKPEDRYRSVGELALELLRFAPKDSRPPPRFSSPPPASGHQRVTVSVADSMHDELALAARDTVPQALGGPRRSGRAALGLVSPDGSVESWSDVLETAPPTATSRAAIYVAVGAALLVALVYVAL